jgi:hypothetical protein
MLKKTGDWNVYYTGDASAYYGSTAVEKGTFAINTGSNTGGAKIYGASTFEGAFTVHAAGILSSGGGAGVRTGTFTMQDGATLVLNPGSFTIQTDSGFVHLNGTTNLKLFLGASDTQAGAGAKLSFQNASGVAWGSGAAVALGTTLNVTIGSNGYIPQPMPENGSRPKFTLIEGLDVFNPAAVAATSGKTYINGEAYDEDAKYWEIEILRSVFHAYYDATGKLILEQYTYTQVPEPSTYALSGSALLLGLALFRRTRTRKRKQAKKK